MIRVEVAAQVDQKEWDTRIVQVAEGSFRQTTVYGAFKAQWREQCLYFSATDEQGRVVGQLLAMSGSPWGWALERRPLSELTLRMASWLAPRLYWVEGPVIIDKSRFEEICGALLQRAIEEGRARGCRSIEGFPSFYSSQPEEHRARYWQASTAAGFVARSKSTLMVDLTQDLDALWEGLRREAQTKVRKARKEGIEIVSLDGSESLMRMAFGVIRETARRNKVAVLPFASFSRSFTYHHNAGVVEAYLSLYRGEPLSFQQVVAYNGNALLGGVSYTDYSREHRLYGNDLMQWHMIERGKERGLRWLDFGGAEPQSADPKMQAIYNFKSKWGGQLVNYDYFSFPSKRSWVKRILQFSGKFSRRVQGGER